MPEHEPRASEDRDLDGPGEVRDDAEWVPEDDAVIGRALRGSFWVIAALVAVGASAAYLMNRPDEAPEETEIAVVAPSEVERDATAPVVAFTDVTAAAGIDFVHVTGGTGEKLLPETMGGGVAFFDYDGDDDPDLLLVNSRTWPHDDGGVPTATSALYRNDGEGRFTDVTAGSGFDLSLYGMGPAVADFDGDGALDVYLTAVGENRLLRNEGGRFVDVTAAAGVAGDADDWSTGAAFFDHDGDGDLDLLVVNYVRWSPEIDFELDFRLTGVGRAFGPPQQYEGTFPRLYRNDGDGTFTDISEASGVRVTNPATGAPMAKALALGIVDADGDGHIDVLVANDTVQNFFFHNQGDGTFEEVGEFWGVAYDRNGNATGAMGVDSAYYRNGPNLGFVIGNFANEMSSIYVAQDDPQFYVDEAIGEGIGAPSRLMLTFGLVLFDYDLDGRLDVLAANGHIEEEIAKVDPSQSYEQPAQLFWNGGDAGFVPVDLETAGDLSRPLVGRGAAYADIDGDGDLDVVLTQVGGPPLLLRNDQQTGHHWLRVRLIGADSNRHAIGAWVELEAGGVTQRRQVMPTRSYLSQVEPEITFGLGEATTVDRLKVRWPDGSEQAVDVGGVDRLEVVKKLG